MQEEGFKKKTTTHEHSVWFQLQAECEADVGSELAVEVEFRVQF